MLFTILVISCQFYLSWVTYLCSAFYNKVCFHFFLLQLAYMVIKIMHLSCMICIFEFQIFSLQYVDIFLNKFPFLYMWYIPGLCKYDFWNLDPISYVKFPPSDLRWYEGTPFFQTETTYIYINVLCFKLFALLNT